MGMRRMHGADFQGLVRIGRQTPLCLGDRQNIDRPLNVSMIEASQRVGFALVRFHISRPWNLALVLIALLTVTPSWAQDKVTLQLKWLHEFQFAGYYAALQQGYYRAAGFDVDIRPGGPDIDATKAVRDGKAEFGVCTTSVLLAKPQDPQITVLGVIYQHSPAILLVPSRAGISTLSDLKGHRIMDSPDDPDVAAMLKHEGIDYGALPRVDHNGDPGDLVT